MAKVKFKKVSPADSSELLFFDDKGNEYSLFTDSRVREVVGVNPDFWDKFYFCKSIIVDYVLEGRSRKITKVISYK
ncbi:hypothetical protein FIU95_16115 [Microbulbifer sp. THAF38]|nr:hypothetical protein FIU95_16115 [Microbulbifer sp. THAF38]